MPRPSMTEELKELGLNIGHRRVGRLMRENGIRVDPRGFPDYAGNQCFNTLGNIEVSGRAGLFIPDFDSGEAIFLTGRAGLDWSSARVAQFEWAERVIDIHPEDVWYARHAVPQLKLARST